MEILFLVSCMGASSVLRCVCGCIIASLSPTSVRAYPFSALRSFTPSGLTTLGNSRVCPAGLVPKGRWVCLETVPYNHHLLRGDQATNTYTTRSVLGVCSFRRPPGIGLPLSRSLQGRALRGEGACAHHTIHALYLTDHLHHSACQPPHN
jgi:hypothetical protein